MENAIPPLIAVWRQIPAPRHRRGVRHPRSALLALACAARLCGSRSYHALAEGERMYDPDFRRALGCTRPPAPGAATCFQTFRTRDRTAVQRVRGAWAQQLALVTTAPVAGAEARAVDGKTRGGAARSGRPGRTGSRCSATTGD